MLESKIDHFKALDILRGLSALAVFISHFCQQFILLPPLGWIGTALELLGVMGVAVFFVLSGFLIHMGALREMQRNGAMNWVNYTRRRFFRVIPAYVVALLVYSLLSYDLQSNMMSPATPIGFFSHLLLVSSFVPGEFEGINAIFWTVIVECHFYAIYPLLHRFTRRFNPWAVFVATWLTGLILFISLSWLSRPGETRIMVQHIAPVLFWQWTLGVLLAETHVRADFTFIRRLFSRRWLVAPLLFLAFGGTFFGSSTVELNFKRFILPFFCWALVGLFTLSAIQRWRNSVGEWLGDVSYSFYLWHPLALAITAAMTLQGLVPTLTASLFFSVALAATSYYLVERPMMAVGHRRA